MVLCYYIICVSIKDFSMNLLSIISHGLFAVMMLFAGVAHAEDLRYCGKPLVVGVGSVFVNEKKATELFGEEYISARKQVMIGKAVTGALANTTNNSLVSYKPFQFSSDDQVTFVPVIEDSAMIGYVVVNTALRLGSDSYCAFDEKYIDQKCDEYLPENITEYAKPVANFIVDLAYDYVTVKLVKGFIGGSNKSE